MIQPMVLKRNLIFRMSNRVYKQEEILDEWNIHLLKIDILIICGGSDARAYEVISKCDKNGVSIKEVILFDVNERKKDVSEQDLSSYEKIFGLNLNITSIKCSLSNPSGAIKELMTVKDKNEFINKAIAVDISSFTKPLFFTLFGSLVRFIDLNRIHVFYTEPKNYLFKTGAYNSYNSSVGPVRVEVIPSYVGKAEQERQVLIFLLGFDGDLAKAVSNEIEPYETILFNGFPSFIPKFKEISLIMNESLLSSKKDKLYYSRANNPFEVFNELERIKSKYSNQNISLNIVPLGSKPMALGACMFALKNSDVRILYPIPENYENKTTNDCLKSWYFDIDL